MPEKRPAGGAVGGPGVCVSEVPGPERLQNPLVVPARRPEALRYENEVSSTVLSIYKVYHLISCCLFKRDAFESVVANVVGCFIIPRHL